MDKILILVDFQKDFLEFDGKLWIGHDTREFISTARTFCQNWQGKIYGVVDTHTEDSPEFQQFPPHCIEGSEGWQTLPWVEEVLCCPAIKKKSFAAYNLMRYLAGQYKGSEFHFAGVLAHICVLENIAALYHMAKEEFNYLPKIIVDSSLVDDLTLDLKIQALERMKNLYAVEIM